MQSAACLRAGDGEHLERPRTVARAIAFVASKNWQAPLATMLKKRASIFVCRHAVALFMIVGRRE